jgi:hypothetical protein
MWSRSRSGRPSPVASKIPISTPSRAAAARKTVHQAKRTWRTIADRVTR